MPTRRSRPEQGGREAPAKRQKGQAKSEQVEQRRSTGNDNNQEEEEEDDIERSVLGGMSGGYRITGDEEDDDEDEDDNITPFKVPFGEDKAIICVRHDSNHTHSRKKSTSKEKMPALVFTHGAGGGIANPATRDFVVGFAQDEQEDDSIVVFQGTMNFQSRIKTFHAVLRYLQREPKGDGTSMIKALGGRSMGARAAVVTASEMIDDHVGDDDDDNNDNDKEQEGRNIEALVLVSYPLVSAGKKAEVRDAILLSLARQISILFIIGSNDSMCSIGHLNEVREKMAAKSWLIEVEGADHGMSLKDKMGMEILRKKTGALAARWLRDRDERKPYLPVRWNSDAKEAECGEWQEQPGTNV